MKLIRFKQKDNLPTNSSGPDLKNFMLKLVELIVLLQFLKLLIKLLA